jgi:hypothetical protein
MAGLFVGRNNASAGPKGWRGDWESSSLGSPPYAAAFAVLSASTSRSAMSGRQARIVEKRQFLQFPAVLMSAGGTDLRMTRRVKAAGVISSASARSKLEKSGSIVVLLRTEAIALVSQSIGAMQIDPVILINAGRAGLRFWLGGKLSRVAASQLQTPNPS